MQSLKSQHATELSHIRVSSMEAMEASRVKHDAQTNDLRDQIEAIRNSTQIRVDSLDSRILGMLLICMYIIYIYILSNQIITNTPPTKKHKQNYLKTSLNWNIKLVILVESCLSPRIVAHERMKIWLK